MSCKDRAWKWVHVYAAGAATLALAPIPGTSLALGGIETHMIYWIAKIYGEELSIKEIAIVAGGLEISGIALKAVAMEALNFLPGLGWVVKSAVAASAVEGIGKVIIDHFEDKYPGRRYSADAGVEGSVTKL